MDGDQDSSENQSTSDAGSSEIKTGDSSTHYQVSDKQTSISEQAFVDRIRSSDRWMIALTAAIAISGIVSAVIFGKQLGAMRDQLTEMRQARVGSDESFSTQLSVMQAQTRAIEGQLEQMRMQQRAFVTASGFRVERTDMSSVNYKSCWKFTPIIINSGVTPTKNMRSFQILTDRPQFTLPVGGLYKYADITSLIIAPSDPERVFRRFAPWPGEVLGPKQELPDLPVNNPVCLTEQNTGSPLAPWRYYASGVIHYNDIFPGTQEHITKYCFWIQAMADGDAFKAAPVLCTHWNCNDDECEADERGYKDEVQRAFESVGTPVPSDFYVDEPPLVLRPIPDEERGKPQR